MITGHQIEHARRLLGWDYDMLALRSGQSVMDIARLERDSLLGSLDLPRQAVRKACENAGIEFTYRTPAGVMLRRIGA